MINNIFSDMNRMQHEMDNLFSELGIGPLLAVRRAGLTDRSIAPLLNLGEDSDNYYIEAQLPGFDLAHLELTVEDNHLKISGARQEETEEGIRWHRSERGQGKFERAIRLPRDIDTEKIEAEGANGVLRMTLPKAESAKPKQISVKTR